MWLHRLRAARADELVKAINPLLRGWCNYHRHVFSKETFVQLDVWLGEALWRWARRRHRDKPGVWVNSRYYRPKGGRRAVFWAEDPAGKHHFVVLPAQVTVARHVLIRGDANPHLPEHEDYFAVRAAKKWDAYRSKRLRDLYVMQEGRCPACGEVILRGQPWTLYHEVPRYLGGKTTLTNVQLAHQGCTAILRRAAAHSDNGGVSTA